MAATITFRPETDDERIIERVRHDGENMTDVIRRALRLLDRQEWLQLAHTDAARLHDERLYIEPDAW